MLCLLLITQPLLQAQTSPAPSVTLQTLSQTLQLLEASLMQAKQQSQANATLLTSYRQKLDDYFSQVAGLKSSVDKLKSDNETLTASLKGASSSLDSLNSRLKDLQEQVSKLEKDIAGMLTQIQLQKEAMAFQTNVIIGEAVVIGAFTTYELLRHYGIVK